MASKKLAGTVSKLSSPSSSCGVLMNPTLSRCSRGYQTESNWKESKEIVQTVKANKIPGSLSLALDGTLKEGHNMVTFGLGTTASLSNLPRYIRFTGALNTVYNTMENQLDSLTSGPAKEFWSKHGDILRRGNLLTQDLKEIGAEVDNITVSKATKVYTDALEDAGADKSGGRLLGHVYCRYFADLMGGQMLAKPTQLALGLPQGTITQYSFNFPSERKEYVENLYSDFNVAGQVMSEEEFKAVVQEAVLCFELNAAMYSEEPMIFDAVRGGLNFILGYLKGNKN